MPAIDWPCPACKAKPSCICDGLYPPNFHAARILLEKKVQSGQLFIENPTATVTVRDISGTIPPDPLSDIVAKQLELMRVYGIHPDQLLFMPPGYRDQLATKVCTATMAEVVELLNELPWKWWHEEQVVDRAKVMDEIGDLLHFVIELAALYDADATEIHQAYLKKNERNLARATERMAARRKGRSHGE